MASLEEIREERIKKIKLLKDSGFDPYPIKTGNFLELESVLKNFSKLAKSKKPLTIVGRLMAKRGQGALIFINLDDGTGRIQGLFKKNELAKNFFKLFSETVDLGDFIEIKGVLFVTKRGEKTILVENWRLLAKSLRPLPDKWHGLKDVEERFRRRYLDSLMEVTVKERFLIRSKMISMIRNFLDKNNFIEVETPMLQPIPGGATAKPFITHHQALDLDLYLRISPELYLKQMLVGGFPKVYEIGRNFRNEGIDQTHNPEFTMLEFYEAFSDADRQMIFVEKLIKEVVKRTADSLVLSYAGHKINFSQKFKTVSYFDLIKGYALIQNPAAATLADLSLKASQLGLKVDSSDSREKILDNIFKKTCRPKIIEPTLVKDYPIDYLPLAKQQESKSALVDAFQLLAGGLELAKGFSELNDPLDQKNRFEIQEKIRAGGDLEAQRKDENFLEAMEYGLPPAGGVGIGIDRLVMLLTNTTNIREVIFFPTLRPK